MGNLYQKTYVTFSVCKDYIGNTFVTLLPCQISQSPLKIHMKEFTEKILQTLKNNGFPDKRVSLPTDKMFEVAESKGFSFNDILKSLKTEHNIEAKIGPDKIIFFQNIAEYPFSGMNQEEMMRQTQEMMSKMDPEELKKIQEMFTNMSPEEKEQIMKKGKDLGLL